MALRSCSIRSYLLNWCWPSFPITSLLPVWLDVGQVALQGAVLLSGWYFKNSQPHSGPQYSSLVGQRQKSKIMLKANWSMIFKREQHNCALYILSPQIYPLVYYPVEISETPNCNVVALVLVLALVRNTPRRNFTLSPKFKWPLPPVTQLWVRDKDPVCKHHIDNNNCGHLQ